MPMREAQLASYDHCPNATKATQDTTLRQNSKIAIWIGVTTEDSGTEITLPSSRAPQNNDVARAPCASEAPMGCMVIAVVIQSPGTFSAPQ